MVYKFELVADDYIAASSLTPPLPRKLIPSKSIEGCVPVRCTVSVGGRADRNLLEIGCSKRAVPVIRGALIVVPTRRNISGLACGAGGTG